MTRTTKPLFKRAAAVIAAMVVLLTLALLFPPSLSSSAAGTDLYVGYSGKSNNFSTVQEAVNKAASINQQRVCTCYYPHCSWYLP